MSGMSESVSAVVWDERYAPCAVQWAMLSSLPPAREGLGRGTRKGATVRRLESETWVTGPSLPLLRTRSRPPF